MRAVPRTRINKAIRIWATGAITGAGTSLAFILTHNALAADSIFELWELGIAIISTTLMIVGLTLIIRSKIYIALPVAYMTLLMPVVGAFFGSSGSEALWQFAVLGMAGGLAWSTPFSLWTLAKNKS
tara:strand:+ start:115 stop:495 length:381 start_codon:yes stop_codon:yes gene_type:complete